MEAGHSALTVAILLRFAHFTSVTAVSILTCSHAVMIHWLC